MVDEQVEMTERMVMFPSKVNAACLVSSLVKFRDAIPVGDKETHVMGYIMGTARALTVRGNNFGDGPSFGLVGVFEAMPADPARPLSRGRVCFLPPSVHEVVVSSVAAGQILPTKKPSVKDAPQDILCPDYNFAFEIGLRRTTNEAQGQGYEFVVSSLMKVEKIDPLAAMRKQLSLPASGNVQRLTTDDVKKLDAPKGKSDKKK